MPSWEQSSIEVHLIVSDLYDACRSVADYRLLLAQRFCLFTFGLIMMLRSTRTTNRQVRRL